MERKSGFIVIWVGQVISLLGSAMTSFALGVWLYQKTGSASNFAFVALCVALPQMLLSPWVGVWVDRFNRRKLMIIADSGSALCTLAMVLLFSFGQVEVWHILVTTILSSSFGAVQLPAYMAMVAGSIKNRNLGRANGLLQLGQALSQIIAPGVAGVLVVITGVAGVLFIDLITFTIAVITLLVSRLPAEPPVREGLIGEKTLSFMAQWKDGLRILCSMTRLTGLMGFQAVFTFLWSFFAVMVTPMLLGFSDPRGLGLIITIAGTGLLTGSLVMTAWGGPQKRLTGLLFFELFSAVAFVIMGLHPILVLVAIGAFTAHFTLAFVSSINDTLWQEQSPPEALGRILALRQTVMRAATLVAYLLAGGLLDRWIEPLLLPGSSLTSSVGLIFGIGSGRGIALLCSAIGLVKIATVLLLSATVRTKLNFRRNK